MPKLKSLSGKEVIRFCEQYGFTSRGGKGSHVNIVRLVAGNKQVVTIPDHKEIDRGTLQAICRQLMLYYIPEQALKSFFYTGNQ